MVLILNTQYSASEKLFTLIEKRLHLMQPIAFYKFQHQLPVYDPKIEKQNMTIVLNQIDNEILSFKAVQKFLETLVKISRKIQKNWLKCFQAAPGELLQNVDLKLLREEVGLLTTQIVKQIYHALPELQNQESYVALSQLIEEKVQNDFITKEDKILLLQRLVACKTEEF